MKLDFQRGYEMGRDSAMRKNKSGCCCKFDEDDYIIELCYAHRIYIDNIIKEKIIMKEWDDEDDWDELDEDDEDDEDDD